MDRLLKFLDVSLVATVGTGLVYLVGYRYLYVYYGHFGLNPLVRDPDVPMVLSFGFVLSVFAAILAFAFGFGVTRWLASRILAVTPFALAGSAGFLLALGVFYRSHTYVDRYVIASAKVGAMEDIESYSRRPEATVTLRDGRTAPEGLRLFFFGKTDVVFLAYGDPDRSSPKVVVIPRSEVLALVVN